MNANTDMLYEFLRVLSIRLTGYGGWKIPVQRDNGALLLELPFGLTAVYGVTSALCDAGAVDFSTVMTVTTAVKKKPNVMVKLQPHLRSWVWDAFEGESERLLGDLVNYYAIKIGETENRASRAAVIDRMT